MPDPSIQIEYNHDLSALVDVLSRVRRPGDFYASGSLATPLPRLDIEGVGVISFPVPNSQAKEIVGQAEQAPYGRGSETLVDTTVRKVWQVMPDKVRFSGATWTHTFETILTRVAQGLGCDSGSVSAELYKLLVYDAGGFFMSHRDTEKAPGMFGTLVVVLPSFHNGGELVVRHAGREVSLDLRTPEVSELTYAAFYADCEHEVRPITEGHRVCLIYNLIQTRAGKDASTRWVAPEYEREIAAATEILSVWGAEPQSAPKLAYLLEHQYSPEGLSFSGLKNADAALGMVLSQAARRAGCVVHLGIVHIEESGSADLPYEPSYRRSRWRRHYNEDCATEEFEVIDVYDSRQYISNWVNLHDGAAGFGEVPLGEGELLPAGALDDEPADVQRVMEATGNEGASFERAYHRAALVLWREEKYPQVLLQGGVGAALPYLKVQVSKWSGQAEASDSSALREHALHVAKLIIDAWHSRPSINCQTSETSGQRAPMLSLLRALGDAALVKLFIEDVIARQYDGSENEVLTTCSRLLGADETGNTLSTLVEKNMPDFRWAGVDLLKRLIAEHGPSPAPEFVRAQHLVAAAVVQGLAKPRADAHSDGALDWRRRERGKPVDAGMVADLVLALEQLGLNELATQATVIFMAHPKIFAPDTVIAPALALLEEHSPGAGAKDPHFAQLWKHTAEFLLARSEFPPAPPTDWAQLVQLDCQCEECRELQAFAAMPLEQVHRFRVRKDRRQHLHGVIERLGLDMTHTTERVGSPQTLICTKTRQRYKALCDQHARDIKCFQSLEDLLHEAPPRELTTLLGRVSSAIRQAARS